MAEKEDESKKVSELLKALAPSVIYIGEDKSFWGTVQSRIGKASETLKFRYVHLTFLSNKTQEELFLQVLRENPAIIYVDFSSNLQKMLKLSKYLHDEVATSAVPRVGLIDSRSLINATCFAGCDFIHIKGGEYHDVVYDPLEIKFSDKIKQPEFATAKFSMDSHLIDDLNVIYYTATGAHIEGNVKLAIGQSVEINNNIPKQRIPSKKFFVKKTGAHDITSDAKFFYDIDFNFVDEPVFNNDELEKAKEIKSKTQRISTIKFIKQDRQEQLERYSTGIEKSKQDQKDWIDEKAQSDFASITRILVVDCEMTAMRDKLINEVSQKPFQLRFQSDFSETLKEVFQMRPAIIALQMLDEDYLKRLIINQKALDKFDTKDRPLTEGEAELFTQVVEFEMSKRHAQLEKIIRRMKEIPNYKPFIIAFNCTQYDSRALQQEFSYPLMMSNSDRLDLKIILDMAEIYRKKADQKIKIDLERKVEILVKTGKMKDIGPEDLREKRYYPPNESDLGIMSYGIPITLVSMTETELKFTTEANLELLQSFRLEHPLSMSVTIVKNKNGEVCEQVDGYNQYRALIHTVDEIDKKYIRQYVNEIIFSPVKEERSKEKEAFKELNEKFKRLKDEQLRERREKADKENH